MTPLLLAALAAPADAGEVRLVYTGDSGGVGGTYWSFESLRGLKALEQSGAVGLHSLQAFHGTMGQDRLLVRAADRSVASTIAFLQTPGSTCDAPTLVMAFETSQDLLLMEPGAPEAWAEVLQPRLGAPIPYKQRRCTNPDGAEAILLSPPDGDRMARERLDAFEFRLALSGTLQVGDQSHGFTITGKPVQEVSRTHARTEALLAESEGALFVDAGNFVDGASSVRDGGLSLHRSLGFERLARLQPVALAPGHDELLPGPAAFLEEARAHDLPYVATNWAAQDEALQLPRSRVVTVDTPDGPVRLAFLGLLDAREAEALPTLAEQGVTLEDPIAAAQREVDALNALPEPPHVIIALTTAGRALQEQVRVSVRGVDVLIGDPTFATLRVVESDVQLRVLAEGAKGAALTLPMDGLATADLVVEDGHLTRVVSTPQLIGSQLPVDPWVTGRVTLARADVYPELDTLLLQARAAAPNEPLTDEEWATMVCEALRWSTGADTVMLGELPPAPRVPGALTELAVVNRLATSDVLELHRVPGVRYQALLDRSSGAVKTTCGGGAGVAKPWGRAVDPTRVYVVVTTRNTRSAGPLEPLLAAATKALPLDPPEHEVLTNPAGQPLTLRSGTLSAMRALRDDPPGDASSMDWLLSDAASAYPPLWTARVNQLSFRVERFRGVPTDAFAEVPETLATSPSSFTLGAASDLAVELSSRPLIWDARFRSSYTTLSTEDNGRQETADDWRASTSLTVPMWALPPKSSFQLRPWSELLFDSEFTPIELEDGTVNPRQADLSLTLGLSATPWKFLKSLRVGGFANRDLARIDEKSNEYGGRLEFSTLNTLNTVKLTTLGDVQVFGNTPDDDAADLRFRAFGEVRLSVPAARWLNLSIYAQGFALRGRVPETDLWAASWNTGAALDMTGAFASRPKP
ncbi:MAG: hypothetical protein H6739_25595 [Alphaproteobacteria bacterium]|nr:hypothetical protein [Alphaproteobacteria bacterium]